MDVTKALILVQMANVSTLMSVPTEATPVVPMPLVQTHLEDLDAHVMMDLVVMETPVWILMNVQTVPVIVTQMLPVLIMLVVLNVSATVDSVSTPMVSARMSTNVNLAKTTVTQMPDVPTQLVDLHVLVTVDSAETVKNVPILMSVQMDPMIAEIMHLAQTQTVGSTVDVTTDFSVTAVHVPMQMNVQLVLTTVTQTPHVLTSTVDLLVHVTLGSLVTARSVSTLMNVNLCWITVMTMPDASTPKEVLVANVTLVSPETVPLVPMLTNVRLVPILVTNLQNAKTARVRLAADVDHDLPDSSTSKVTETHVKMLMNANRVNTIVTTWHHAQTQLVDLTAIAMLVSKAMVYLVVMLTNVQLASITAMKMQPAPTHPDLSLANVTVDSRVTA